MGFCHLLTIWVNITGKTWVRKNLSIKYSQKVLDHAKQSAKDALKTASKKAIQKPGEATGDLIGNKIADRIKSFKIFATE